MFMKRLLRRLRAPSSALALLAAWAPASFGQATLGQPCCGQAQCCPTSCNWWCCPPPLKYCAEGPPCIYVCCGCPKPVCCPSDAPNWGYFPTVWRPSPWAPNWSYCYGVPPAAQVVVPLANAGGAVHSMPLQPGADLPGQPSGPRASLPQSTMRVGS
jgi:hypothetical protein